MRRPVLGVLPTRRLAGVVALGSAAWLLSSSPAGVVAAVAIVAAIIVAVAVDWVRGPSPHEIEVERQLPPTVGIGERIAGEYVLRSRWRRLRGVLHDAPPRGVERDRDGGAAPAADGQPFVARAGVDSVLGFGLTGRERGSHPLGPVVLRVLSPLGLLQRTLRYAPGDAILVTPSLAGVRRYRLLAVQHRLRDAGVRAVRRRGRGTTFANLREYAVGDDPRHIDWKASARRRTLISREYTVEQGQTVMIAIDAGRMMTQLAGPLPRFEHALSSALVLADIAIHSGDRVGVMVFDDQVRAFVPPARGRAALRLVRDALVTARSTMVEPDYAMAFRTLAARHRKRSLIVVFTDVVDTRSSRAILAHTARSAARHLPLVVALRNDQLAAATDPAARTTTTQLYESAAAEELVSAREEVLTRMRRAGVSVLDVSPQRMTAGVINRYLELKARASL